MITILTTTYNRAHTLQRLYESIKNQESKDFEWLIIDDGSTDSTANLIKKFQNDDELKIRYHTQANGGKHVALNNGVNLSLGNWVFIVDSDDALTPDAIQSIRISVNELDAQDVVGICFRKAYFNGVIVGLVPNEKIILSQPTLAGRLLKGDLAYVFKKNALKLNPFPVINGEKFVPELYIWNKISDLGKIYFYTHKYIYLCEYLDDGYSKNFKKNLKLNPRGFLKYYLAQISRESDFRQKLKCGVRSLQCVIYSMAKLVP